MTLRTAQQHGQKYMPRLLRRAAKGELDPSFISTHGFGLDDSVQKYEMFKNKSDGCVRPVFSP